MFVDGHYIDIMSALPAALLRHSESGAHKKINLTSISRNQEGYINKRLGNIIITYINEILFKLKISNILKTSNNLT